MSFTPTDLCPSDSCTGGSICYQRTNGYRVLKSATLRLMAECENCADSDTVSYQWTIYLQAYRWPAGWRNLRSDDLADRTVGEWSLSV